MSSRPVLEFWGGQNHLVDQGRLTIPTPPRHRSRLSVFVPENLSPTGLGCRRYLSTFCSRSCQVTC